jgi:hypothetical protein
MTTRTWIRKAFESKKYSTHRPAPARRRLNLEALEDRAMLTVSFGPAGAHYTGLHSP